MWMMWGAVFKININIIKTYASSVNIKTNIINNHAIILIPTWVVVLIIRWIVLASTWGVVFWIVSTLWPTWVAVFSIKMNNINNDVSGGV